MPDIHPTPEELKYIENQQKKREASHLTICYVPGEVDFHGIRCTPHRKAPLVDDSIYDEMEEHIGSLITRIRALEAFIVGRKREHYEECSLVERWDTIEIGRKYDKCTCGADFDNAASQEMVPWG